MEKAKTSKDKYIRLSDLIYAVLDRIIILIIIGAVIAAGVFAIGYIKGQKALNEKPSYMTYLELYMGPKANISSGTAYSELFLSDSVIKQVIEAENIDASVDEVRACLYAEEKEATLFRLVILSSEKELTEKIAKGMSTVGLSDVASTVDSSQMKVIQYPTKPSPVKSDIPKIQAAYRAMSVKTFPADLVKSWETYVNESKSISGMIKKGLFSGVAGAGFIAICLMVAMIFKRKLRYPEDIEYTSGMKVILTVDHKQQGVSALARKLVDVSEKSRSFLFIGAKEGEGTTTMAKAAADGIASMGEQVTSLKVNEVSEGMIESNKGYIIADGGSFAESYDAVSLSKMFDGTVLVIGEDSIDDMQINRMRTDLIAAGANIVGIILNKAKINRWGRKSRYYGSYYGAEK